MNPLVTLILVISFFTNAFCQSPLLERLEVTGQFAYQEHDQRFFTGHLDESGWGTTQFRYGMQARILSSGKLNLNAGLGLGFEQNTYMTGFNHCFFTSDGICDQALRHIDRYMVTQQFLPIKVGYNLNEKLTLQFEALPIFSLRKNVLSTNQKEFSKSGFDFYGLELLPGLEYRTGPWAISAGYRLFNWKAIDMVYEYGGGFLLENPGYLNQKLDTHNPFKLQIGLSYKLNTLNSPQVSERF